MRHTIIAWIPGSSLIGLALCTAPAAAENIKPGPWEIQNRMGGSGDMGNKMAAAQAEMQKQLAAMLPEQRNHLQQSARHRRRRIRAAQPRGLHHENENQRTG
ncbi:MAG: hypothetical protein RLZZ445_2552 [Pseudomonadota bacterium]|jgi:hypothetical protein